MSNDISSASLGLMGIRRGMNGLKQNAQQIASANTQSDAAATQAAGSNTLAGPLVEMKLNKQLVETSAKVIQTHNDLIGTLLDIKA